MIENRNYQIPYRRAVFMFESYFAPLWMSRNMPIGSRAQAVSDCPELGMSELYLTRFLGSQRGLDISFSGPQDFMTVFRITF